MLRLIARHIGTLALAACFGVSGCVSTDGDGESGPSVTELSYQGATGPADIEGANATGLAKAILSTGASVDALPLRVTNARQSRNGLIAASAALRGALDRQGPVIAVGGVHPFVSVMEECDDGGQMVATREGRRLHVEYFDCREGSITINGSAQRVGDDDDNTVTIHGIRLTAPGLDLSFRGSFSFLESGATGTLTLHDLIIRDKLSRRTIKTEHIVISEIDVMGGDHITIDGRLFVSEFGYVDVVTAPGEPLFLADGDDYPSSGRLTLTGRHGESIVIMPLSSTQVNVVVDTDGEPGTEIDEILTWAELEAAIGLP